MFQEDNKYKEMTASSELERICLSGEWHDWAKKKYVLSMPWKLTNQSSTRLCGDFQINQVHCRENCQPLCRFVSCDYPTDLQIYKEGKIDIFFPLKKKKSIFFLHNCMFLTREHRPIWIKEIVKNKRHCSDEFLMRWAPRNFQIKSHQHVAQRPPPKEPHDEQFLIFTD